MTNYSYPNLTGSTNPFVTIASYANTVTSGVFWYLMLILIFGVSFISLKSRTSTNKSFLTSFYIVTVLSSLLSMTGLISPDFVIFAWIITGLLTVLVYYEER
jgi:hypothetical protein